MAACTKYRGRGRREWNKRRDLVAHLKRHPGDTVAQAALKHIAPRPDFLRRVTAVRNG